MRRRETAGSSRKPKYVHLGSPQKRKVGPVEHRARFGALINRGLTFLAGPNGHPVEADPSLCHALQRLARGKVGGNGVPKSFSKHVKETIESRNGKKVSTRSIVFLDRTYHLTVSAAPHSPTAIPSYTVCVRPDTVYVDLSPLVKQGFTRKQVDILTFLQRGHTFALIADALGCSRETVKTHVKRLRMRLGASGCREVVALAVALCVGGTR